MTTKAVPDGGEILLTTALATTPTHDFRQMRSFSIRANATVTVTVFASRVNETSRFKNLLVNGSDLTLALTDKWLVLTSDQALAMFSSHFLRFVAASGTPTIEIMASA
jgi:hypothetical protein